MKILCTGFAGTLGSEFTRFFLERGDLVVGIDNNEWAVAAFPDMERLDKRLGSFNSGMTLFEQDRYGLVVHCAAYKHVDLIEHNQISSWQNNVHNTYGLYSLCKDTKAPILFISTDKAVEPASYYGQTKQKGEEMTCSQGGIIARLGNISGSNGSVIPKWEAQLERGEPLSVTDPRMTRYMIPAKEAVEKIMALYPHAGPGDVIVPEMGAPVPLMDIARETIQNYQQKHDLDTHTSVDRYPINVIGRRPGEKTHEKLLWDDEKPVYTDGNGVIVRR